MHEVSLVHALFDHADRALHDAHGPHPDGRSAVRVLSVRMGALAGVERELFVTAFEIVRQERGYGSASLELSEAEGRELILERMELEVRDV